MDETDVLVAYDLDLVNETEAAEVVTEHLFCHALVETAEIDVATGTILLNSHGDLSRNS